MNRLRALRAIVRRRIHSIIDVLSVTTPLILEGSYIDGTAYYYNPVNGLISDAWTIYYVGTGNSDGHIDTDFTKASITLTTPEESSEVNLDTDIEVSGSVEVITDEMTLTIQASNDAGSSWIDLDDSVSISEGSYSVNVQLTEADGFAEGNTVVFRVIYGSVESNTRSVEVVGSETGLVEMNATCSATTPESIEKEAGSEGMNATCSADTPTSI